MQQYVISCRTIFMRSLHIWLLYICRLLANLYHVSGSDLVSLKFSVANEFIELQREYKTLQVRGR